MKILIEMGLGDSLIDCLVRPLIRLEYVHEVLIVQNWTGPSLPKVQYYCPPRFITRLPTHATLYKMFILIYLALFKRPDFIHSFILFPHGIMAFIAGKLSGKSVGITLNAGPSELYGVGGVTGVNYTLPLPWFGKIFLWILKHCDTIVAINSFTKEFLVSHGVNIGRIHIMPQPVDTDRFQPMDIPKKYDVISVGRLAPVKHTEVLLEATAMARQLYPGIRVGIVGDGPSRTLLEKLAEELGISDNVEFVGYKENVEYYYNSAKVFVLTSEREAGPLALTEAMACGIQVISSKCGIVPDIGQDGFNCVIIENYNNSTAFSEAIVSLLNDKELYYKLSENALQTARNITIDSATDTWKSIFEQCSIPKIRDKSQR
ncbi:glycosyltransferase [Chloroflexota bacterium]